MKKLICLLLTACLLFALAACGGNTAEPETKEWSRQGSFEDGSGNYLLVTSSDTEGYEGWSVTFMPDGEMIGWVIQQEGNALHGNLRGWDENEEPFIVTVSEEGEDGLKLEVEGGETYHFTPVDIPEATIFVSVNTDGLGRIAYAEEGETLQFDDEFPAQSAQLNLAEPAVYAFGAKADQGWVFVKWTKNGEDYAADENITVDLTESADYVAVFEEDPDWQNPVMNFVGEYQCDRAHASVECFGYDEAWITIDWGSSARELTRWIIVGALDTETLTIDYSGCTKSNLVCDDNGDVKSEDTEYNDGTGTITFNADGSFTWHDDRGENKDDMVFEWMSVTGGDEAGIANPWRDITEAEALELCPNSFAVPAGAENVQWRVLDSVADPSGIPGALIQLSFDLDGNRFTAREQITADADADISGMYYDWTYRMDEPLSKWGDMTCHAFLWIGEDGYADLCTWYEAETGISYSLSVTAADLDGFDLLAVVEAMNG